MNKEEIIAGSKLIFDFLGKEYAHWTFENRTSWISARKDLSRNVYKSFTDYEDLKYHTSMDWIFPVVEKIQLALIKKDEEVCIELYMDIETDMPITFVDMGGITSENAVPAIALWKACIQYIEQYNSQDK
jgi:hypothetical protein